jgi:hypothetical protein
MRSEENVGVKAVRQIAALSERVAVLVLESDPHSLLTWESCVELLIRILKRCIKCDQTSALCVAGDESAEYKLLVSSSSDLCNAAIHAVPFCKLPSEIESDDSGILSLRSRSMSLLAACMCCVRSLCGDVHADQPDMALRAQQFLESSHASGTTEDDLSDDSLLAAFELALVDEGGVLPDQRIADVRALGSFLNRDESNELASRGGDQPCREVLAFMYFTTILRKRRGDFLKALLADGDARLSSPSRALQSSIDARLEAIVTAGDSNDGMAVFNDLMVSFWLPRKLVVVRSTLLLGRRCRRAAERSCPHVLQCAHHVAMQGPLRVWMSGVLIEQKVDEDSSSTLKTSRTSNGQETSFMTLNSSEEAMRRWKRNEIHIEQTCAILSGLAMLTSKSSEEVRTAKAFGGKVDLPFLNVRPPPPSSTAATEACMGARLMLCGSTWFFYTTEGATDARSSDVGVRIMAHGDGMEGLKRCAALFADALR